MANLILVRHGESVWNAKGLWTGWTDIPLTERGREEARATAQTIKENQIDLVYISTLSRSKQTWEEIQKVLGLNPPVIENEALNERNYGDYTGKNKWDVQKQVGEEEFQNIRRSWDHEIPNGESLKQVYERVVPYYKTEIETKLKEGKNILLSLHGNSMRALVKYLDNISDQDIPHLEIATGEAYVYQVDSNGKILKIKKLDPRG